ncbi:Piso0_002495 [Millerozyma farinosa CBS 7064]|uniref:uS12 prolyl 3,4-dihydroxylase n=1 Tax=Pichia sorbitophila (strain ATCC MYA-4447 / BCRC 22081 / CBS 7064 / NBRC 10061 / NRRL Y-12695) TaxID=559304 RepID=G8YF71_PICSO|nr:Piso0_002495 [Millerozyma farinosa CBS 7064]
MTQKRDLENKDGPSAKKVNLEFKKEEIEGFFNDKIWDNKFQEEIKEQVEKSQPYRWGTITELMNDELLRNVRQEVLNEIAFKKKETDIYKVHQSGDLANLSGLDWDDLSRLPSLYKLRAGIYSEEFRDMISRITGSGKLSGVKTDMSINTYTKGCHLLTHDDVIGSRRVSFILYLPDPDKKWKPHYGGALRLFPAIVPNVPKTDYEVKLVPQFNQIAFFTVQPGLSFHDVEEVRADKHRLSIQGWFHIPQEGEPGYIPGEQEATEARSTLQQLQNKELQEYDFPKPIRNDIPADELKLYRGLGQECAFSPEEYSYLRKYLNAQYLEPKNLQRLADVFMEESLVELGGILNDELAGKLMDSIRDLEINTKAPAHSSEIHFPWKCAMPPHKQRFMYIDGKESLEASEEGIKFINRTGPQELPNFQLTGKAATNTVEELFCQICSFFKSIAFRKWLLFLTRLIPTSDQILLRRFRPGSDFILATSTDSKLARDNTDEINALLEATFNFTPTATNSKNWESGEFGGYELCMSSNASDDEDEEDDPAIYRESDPNDDSVLYTSQCKWNSLCLMLRDPSILKFVKYVSVNAKGSRWDISCQWNVESSDKDDEDEDAATS